MLNVLRSYLPFLVWLFLVALALKPIGSAAAEPGASGSQPVRIGFVSGGTGPTFEAFRNGIREAGYAEGRDVIIEARFSDGKAERFPALIAELLSRPVDILVAGSPPGVIAALRADTSIPIVIAGVGDPAAIAKQVGRPAGHVTGVALPIRGVGTQWIPLLKGVKPGVRHVAVLTNPANPSRDVWVRDLRDSAERLDVRLAIHDVGNAAGLDKALATIRASAPDALLVTGDPVFLADRAKIVAFAADCELPAGYFSTLFADAGGLLAYGPSLEDSYRRAPGFVARILKGAKPADLAIEEARVELAVNLRAARALNLAIPKTILERADKVIE